VYQGFSTRSGVSASRKAHCRKTSKYWTRKSLCYVPTIGVLQVPASWKAPHWFVPPPGAWTSRSLKAAEKDDSQWIELRENLQEATVFTMTYRVFAGFSCTICHDPVLGEMWMAKRRYWSNIPGDTVDQPYHGAQKWECTEYWARWVGKCRNCMYVGNTCVNGCKRWIFSIAMLDYQRVLRLIIQQLWKLCQSSEVENIKHVWYLKQAYRPPSVISSLLSEKLVYYMVVHFEGPFGNFRALTKMVPSGWKIIFPLAEILVFHLLNSAISPVLLRAKDLYRLKLLCKHIMSAMKNTPPPSHCTGGFVNFNIQHGL
jgi:hypothetical protein